MQRKEWMDVVSALETDLVVPGNEILDSHSCVLPR
jgi:hypothetical protein